MLTDEQYKIIQDTLDMYGESLVEKTKVLKMISQHHLWRHPHYSDLQGSEKEFTVEKPIIASSIVTENTVFSV